MRVLGVQFWGASGPVQEAYVDLTAPAVIAGANDSGKTRLLETVAAGLAALRVEVPGRGGPSFKLYFESPPWPDALDCDGVLTGHPSLLPTELLEDVHSRLASDSDVTVPRTFSVAWGTVVNGGEKTERLLVALCVTVRDLERPALADLADELRPRLPGNGAPLTLGVMGALSPELMPIVHRVEDLLEVALEQVDDAVTQLAAALRVTRHRLAEQELLLEFPAPDGLADGLLEEPEPGFEDWQRSGRARRALVIEGDRGARLHEDVRVAADYFAAAVGSGLPDFVAQRYDPLVDVPSAADLLAGAKMALSMKLLDRPDTSFPVAMIAGGYRTWVSLALSTGLEFSRRLAEMLDEVTGMVTEKWERLCDTDGLEDEPTTEQLRATVRQLFDMWGVLQLTVRDPGSPLELSEDLRSALTGPESGQPARSLARIYLFDEPEQNLHNRLQRTAARWLGWFAETEGGSLILTTHSTAFITEIPDASVYEVVRAGGPAAAITRRAKPLTATDLLAVELGIDRGELLAAARVFLFVEGLADQEVLENLYSERLRAAGVVVMAAHGHRKLSGVIQMEFVLTHLGTPIAFMLDRLWQRDVELMRRDAGHRVAVLRDSKDERHTAASIIAAEERASRRFEVLGIAVDDVFDALDDGAVRRVFPRYPGHAAAQRQFAASGERQNAERRKAYYHARWRVSHRPVKLAEIARIMRNGHLESPQLDSVVSQVEALAFASEHRRGDPLGY